MAIEIKGNWKKGYALDKHTISSEYLGKNEFGHDHYKTKRTIIGELVYQLKYKNDSSVVQKLVNEVKKCVSGIDKFDFIIPILTSDTSRPKQPVQLVCNAISNEFNVPILSTALFKEKTTKELKNIAEKEERIKELKNVIKISDIDKLRGKKILLIDDLYRSGATLLVATDLLYKKGDVKTVCVLTLTKTRSSR